MSLKTKIDTAIKEAMKSKSTDALRALRSIKAMILLAETADGNVGQLNQDQEIRLLIKAAKQRRESAEMYVTNARQELADVELAELAIIEQFLPKQLTEAEIIQKVKEIITKVGATGAKDMGKVMGVTTKELAGLVDGKLVAEIVKKALSN